MIFWRESSEQSILFEIPMRVRNNKVINEIFALAKQEADWKTNLSEFLICFLVQFIDLFIARWEKLIEFISA